MLPQPLEKTVVLQKFTQKWVGNYFRILKKMTTPNTWLNWETEPGDVILFHPLVIHGSGGNQSSNQRRRTLAMRFLGDDVVWVSRPGTFIEKETIQELLPELNLKDGDQLESPCFPLIRTFSIQPETQKMKQNSFQENSIRNSSHE